MPGQPDIDPVLKALVGRLRPVVAHPIAYGKGDSFPSGHALGSIVCYGALFLVFLPATRGMWRRVFTAVIVTLIAAIGITWLGVTAFAFELSRQAAGAPVTDPRDRGPRARGPRRPPASRTGDDHAT